MRWSVAFLCSGLGVLTINCGGSSRSSLPSTGSEAGTGGRDTGGVGPAEGKGGAATSSGGSIAYSGADAGGGGAGLPADGAAGGDGSCACDSKDPVCIEQICGESSGACTALDYWLAYENHLHEPLGRAQDAYGVCDDGTTRFSSTDPLGESGLIVVFDSDGHLTFDGNYLRARCGVAPPLDNSPTCQWCDVLRAGGLSRVGEAGAGGEGGAGAAPTDEQGMPYCFVDSDGKLVMPTP